MSTWSPVDLLPGLWVAILAVLLERGLRRWYDAVPGAVFAAFGAVLLILFAPVLLGGRILLPLDNLRGAAPFRELPPTTPHGNILQGDLIEMVAPSLAIAAEDWIDGRWPLWNPRAGAGLPLLADPQAQAMQPLVLLSLPLPWLRAPAAIAAIRVLCALVFTFLWMRRQGLGVGPALAGAFAFGLGGFLLLWLGWPLANSAALLPAVLYALARCHQIGGRRDLLLLALAGFCLFLGGHPETVLYATAFALAVLAEQALDRAGGEAAAPVALRSLRRQRARAALLALLLAALAAAPALLPTLDYLPQTLRASRLQEPLAAVAAAAPGADLARRWLPVAAPNAYGNSRFVGYWGLSNTNEDASGFVGTAALLAAGAGLGGLRGRPRFQRFPQERLALFVAALCLLVLSHAFGRLLPPALSESRRLLLVLSLCLAYLAACGLERIARGEMGRWPVLAAAAVLAAVIVWGYLAHPDPADPQHLAVLRFGWLRWQLRFLVLAALLLALGRGRRWMPPAVAALVAAELLLAHLPANPPMPRRLAFPDNGPLTFLEDHARRTRVAGLGRALPPNLAGIYGLYDARVYNPMAPRAYLDWLSPVIAGWWGEMPELAAVRPWVYRRLGVRYLLTGPEAALPKPFHLAFRDGAAAVWGVPGPYARIFLADGEPAAANDLWIQDLRPSWNRLAVRARRPRRLESSVYQDGGWRVLANGVRLAEAPTDGPFVAAALPVGAWDVDLLYRPRAHLAGCLLAALGLAGGAAWLAPRPLGARRAEPGVTAPTPAPPLAAP